MAKKFIAAALLLTTMAWAELALAPMLLMHVWHHQAPPAMPARMASHHHHAEAATHPCCPGLHRAVVAPLELSASGIPCSDEHRCCFRQAPPNVPAPTGAKNDRSSDLAQAQIALTDFSPNLQPTTPVAASAAVRPPPLISGMVLRV